MTTPYNVKITLMQEEEREAPQKGFDGRELALGNKTLTLGHTANIPLPNGAHPIEAATMTLTESQLVGFNQPKMGSQKPKQFTAVPDSCEVEGSGNPPTVAGPGHLQGAPATAGNSLELAMTAGKVAEVSGGGRAGTKASRRQKAQEKAQAAVATAGWQWEEQGGEVSEGQGMSQDACTIVDDKVASLTQRWPASHPNSPVASPAR